MILDTFRDEFAHSGEQWMMERIKHCDIKTVFDVGANRGAWAALVNEQLPNTIVHSFELVPDTYVKLLREVHAMPNIIPNGFGLSDTSAFVQVKQCTSNDAWSTTLHDMAPGTVGDSVYHWISALVLTGDAYATSRAVDYIDLLKIDTEGAEGRVLAGFTDMLKADKIGAIQFEYGTANIVAKWLLMDAYALLTPLGFVLGILKPGGVSFVPYTLTMEDFVGPNVVAVHKSRQDLIRALAV